MNAPWATVAALCTMLVGIPGAWWAMWLTTALLRKRRLID